MAFSYLLAVASGIPYLITVLLISLLLMSLDCLLCEKRSLSSCLHNLDNLFSSFVLNPRSFNKYLYLGCLSLLGVYLFMPMGSLKVYFDTSFETVIIAILLLSAQSLNIRGIRMYSLNTYMELEDFEHMAMSKFILCLIIVGSSITMYQLGRGIPGNIMSLDSVTAMPFWTVVGGLGVIGFACFFLMFAITDPARGGDYLRHYPSIAVLEVYVAMRACTAPALAVAIFVPWNPAIFLGMNRVAMFSMDYAFFWLKVALLQLFIFPVIRKLYSGIESRMSIGMRFEAPLFLGLLGAAALYADYLLA